jgi:hypothetical protein
MPRFHLSKCPTPQTVGARPDGCTGAAFPTWHLHHRASAVIEWGCVRSGVTSWIRSLQDRHGPPVVSGPPNHQPVDHHRELDREVETGEAPVFSTSSVRRCLHGRSHSGHWGDEVMAAAPIEPATTSLPHRNFRSSGYITRAHSDRDDASSLRACRTGGLRHSICGWADPRGR